MISLDQARLALVGLHVLLPALRRWPTILCVVALAACGLPFLLSESKPIPRVLVAMVTWPIFARMLRYAAGHERPRGLHDFLQFLMIAAVVRWESPRRPDRARAWRCILTAVVQSGLAIALIQGMRWLDLRHPVELVTAQIRIYLVVAAVFNVYETWLSLRGLDYDPPFDSPFLSRTPAEFWARRWNTWIHAMLHQYVFLPCGGRRHPVRGTFAAFGASGIFHVGLVAAGTLSLSGWMLGYFLLQGALVVGTSRSRFFRRLARRRPALTAAMTLAVILATGCMLLRLAADADPTLAWQRCCGSD